MRMKIKDKKRFMGSILLMFLILLIMNNGTKLFKDASGRINEDNNQNTLAQWEDKSIVKPKDIKISEQGNILLEENNNFKRFTIVFDNIETFKGYDETNKYLTIDLDNLSALTLDSQYFKEESKEVFLAEVKGNNRLVVKKSHSDNNFVFLNELEGQLIVLISKVQNPFINTVVLDPGHGGVDPGAPALDKSFDEKEITLKITKRIRTDLIYSGCRVFMSREEDKTIKLEDIVDYTEEVASDIFVSVHINSYEKSNVYNGIETYYSKDNPEAKESAKLAESIQNKIISNDGWKDRGVVQAPFYVIKKNKIPAVLVECGFASNQEDVNRLNDNEVLNNLSKNIAKGIMEYLLEE